MSRMLKILLATLLGGALIFGAVFGVAASMGVGGVDNLGSGSVAVIASPDVDDVQWIIAAGDYTAVSGVTIEFNTALSANSKVYVILYNTTLDPDVKLDQGANTNASGTTVTVTLDNIVEAALINKIHVTVLDH